MFGPGGVQTLDGEDHLHRKRMFMSIMTPVRIERLCGNFLAECRAALGGWRDAPRIVLYNEMILILTRAVCRWAGAPLPEAEVGPRAAMLKALFHDAGRPGGHLWSRWCRRRADLWAARVIERIRAGEIEPGPDRPARIVAEHRGRDGELLPARVAGVELLNLLRPTVAVAVYIVWLAHALHEHPQWRERLTGGEGVESERFVQETRRFYPFFPVVAAIVRDRFEHDGVVFERGRRAVLDLYGTDHDPRTWNEPDSFDPGRFRAWDRCPFNLIPQGGGEHESGHRCAGEWITIGLMKTGLAFLTSEMRYEVPPQRLGIGFGELPALPGDRMVLSRVGAIG